MAGRPPKIYYPVSMDSRVESDKVEFANMENDSDSTYSKSSRLSRFTGINWLHHLPTVLSLLALVLILGTIIGTAIHINNLSNKIDSIDNSLTNGGASVPSAQQQKQTTPQSSEDLSGVQQKLTALRQQISDLRAALGMDDKNITDMKALDDIKKMFGTTYTRWGRSTCPSGDELVYTGFAAGSSASSSRLTGGGSNYLCMHPEAEWNKFDMKNDSLAFSWLYSAELLTYSIGIFDDDVHGGSIACSVCRAPRATQTLIPGRRTCPDSWTLQYEGYIMSSYVTQHKMSYICVDQEPETLEGSHNVTGGATLYFVSGYCNGGGGLNNCPPYVHAREITCVMCTK